MKYLLISTIEFIALTIISVILFKKGIFGFKGFGGVFNIILAILCYGIIRVVIGKFVSWL